MAHVRLGEILIAENLNYPSLVMTRAWRCKVASQGGKGLEFGSRRSPYPKLSTLWAMLAGFYATSFDEIRRRFDFVAIGTMGHEWIQSFLSQLEAFTAWIESSLINAESAGKPPAAVLLINTINTLGSGIHDAITAFDMYRDRIVAAGGVFGVRLDSGDLAFLTMAVAKELRKAGYPGALIVLSSDLNEFEITRIRGVINERAYEFGLDPQQVLAQIVWGVGTQLVTCEGHPSLGGVTKLVWVLVEHYSNEIIKLSNTPAKVSIPGNNRSAWVLDGNGELVTVLVYPASYRIENGRLYNHRGDSMIDTTMFAPDQLGLQTVLQRDHYLEPRQQLLFDSIDGPGISAEYHPTINDVIATVAREAQRLHWSQRDIVEPYKINLSLVEPLFRLRQAMREQRVLHASQLA